MNVGDKVHFGRTHGEKTLGEVVKVNPTTVKVKQLEARGTMRDYPVGTIWKVPHKLCSPVGGVSAPAATPVPWKRTPTADGWLPVKAKRPDAEILRDIAGCYSSLSPENLFWDGERPVAQARAAERALNAKLKNLFIELGRKVDEAEAYAKA